MKRKNMLFPIVAAIAMTIVCTAYAEYNGKWGSWNINGIDENNCVMGGEGGTECSGECVKDYERFRECYASEDDPECNEYDYEWEYVSSISSCNSDWCNCEEAV